MKRYIPRSLYARLLVLSLAVMAGTFTLAACGEKTTGPTNSPTGY